MKTREEERREREEAFGDAVYEVWRAGGDSDAVEREQIDDAWYECYDREETVQRVVNDNMRKRDNHKEYRI